MPAEQVVVHVIDDDEAVRHSLAFLLQSVDIPVETYDTEGRRVTSTSTQ